MIILSWILFGFYTISTINNIIDKNTILSNKIASILLSVLTAGSFLFLLLK